MLSRRLGQRAGRRILPAAAEAQQRSWKQIYEGPTREFVRSNLADGEYCYRVMALNATMDSEWSVTKCTAVDRFYEHANTHKYTKARRTGCA